VLIDSTAANAFTSEGENVTGQPHIPFLQSSSLAEVKSKAYLIYAEWGPPRLIPREQRLAECFPDIPENTRLAWMKEFDQVEAAIWKAAEAGGPRTGTFEVFTQRMTKSFPFLNDEALSHAWTLASYYTAHEGY
jgi:hypothetical protein